MKILYATILFASVLVLACSGCYYDVEEELYGTHPCDTSNVTFITSVQPIIAANCLSCHSGNNASANISLDGYDNLKPWADNGILSGTVNHSAGFSPMPKNNPKLSACDLATIRIWIDAGAQNN